MGKVKCDYCGEYFDEAFMAALDNGSPACPKCVSNEDRRKKEYQEKEKDK